MKALGSAACVAGLVVLVLGGDIYRDIYANRSGWDFGCVGALAIMIFKRRFNLLDLRNTLMDTGFTTAGVLLLLWGWDCLVGC